MFIALGLLGLSFTVISAVPAPLSAIPAASNKISGGSDALIAQYPYAAALLYSFNQGTYSQSCGGTLISNRAVLSAAHCFYSDAIPQWRIRLGSSDSNGGGWVYSLSDIRIHTSFNYITYDNDIAILISSTPMSIIRGWVEVANLASPNYNLGDNQAVWAIGWGETSSGAGASIRLKHAQIWSINQASCKARYNEIGWSITENMLCAGWLAGRDQCQGDNGSPLIHNGVVVGICSWGNVCGLPRYPAVNTRVSKYNNWIAANSGVL